MEITALELLGYLIAWSIFYFVFASYVARLSKDAWVEWAKSMGFVADLLMKRQGLDGLLKGPNSPEQGSNKPQTRPKMGLE